MDNPHRVKFIYYIETLILTTLLWFVLSGIFELKFIAFGIFSCLIISAICVRGLCFKGIKTDKTYCILHCNYFKLIKYFGWLIKEVVIAAVYVSKLSVLNYDDFSSGIVCFKADYDNPVARILLANSITLTPGTVTVDIYNEGYYTVHSISEELREGLLNGAMQQRVAAVFGETIDFQIIPMEKLDNPAVPYKWKKSGDLRKRRISGE